ncbi:MAG: chemotaxis-specific protein-glutamate methyltransferase CheB [Solirubrobacteraceae bacterium]|jgi:two-component system chemotaxis response regulator CheB
MRVLVVDDSAFMRKAMRGIFEDANMEVAVARDGVDALEQVRALDPDVVTLDINMPEMDGLTCLAKLIDESPRPVVMVSSLTEKGAAATLEALELGAVDYVCKPDGTVSLNIDLVAKEMVAKVRAAATARPRRAGSLVNRLARQRAADSARAAAPAKPAARHDASRIEVVLIGASTGGPGILGDLLRALPAGFPAPVIIAQHIPASFTKPLADRLDAGCALSVRELVESRPLVPGTVMIARGDADVVLTRRAGAIAARSVPAGPTYRWHPSIERLVRSALTYCDPRAIVAAQLTGMGDDGVDALCELHSLGGLTVAESQETAVVFGMPGELIRRGGATKVLPISAIAAQLNAWV